MDIEKRTINFGKPTEHTRIFLIGGYEDTLNKYLDLVGEAKRDFSSLQDWQISLGKILDGNKKGHICISFLAELQGVKLTVQCKTHPQYTPEDYNGFKFY